MRDFIKSSWQDDKLFWESCNKKDLNTIKTLVNEKRIDLEALILCYGRLEDDIISVNNGDKHNLDLLKYFVEELKLKFDYKYFEEHFPVIFYSKNWDLIEYVCKKFDTENKFRTLSCAYIAHWICHRGDFEFFKKMVDYFNPDYLNYADLIVDSCMRATIEMFEYFAKKLKKEEIDFSSCLEWACAGGNFQLVMHLLNEYGKELGIIDYSECLKNACWSGSFDLARYFIEKHNVQITIETFRRVCSGSGAHLDLLKYVFDKCNNKDILKNNAEFLRKVSSNIDFEMLKFLIEEVGLDVNVRDESNNSLLSNLNDNIETLKYLIDKCRMEINKKDIIEMLENGTYKNLKYLIEEKDALALFKNEWDFIEKFLESLSMSRFDTSPEYDEFDFFRYLTEKTNFDINLSKDMTNLLFKSWLNLDSHYNRILAYKYLLEDRKADINKRGLDIGDLIIGCVDKCAERIWLRDGDLEWINTMKFWLDYLKIPIDLNKLRDSEGKTLLTKCASLSLFKYLIDEKNMDINLFNILDNNAKGAIYYFCKPGVYKCWGVNINLLNYLIEKGAKFSAEDIKNLLDAAYRGSNFRLFKWLLKNKKTKRLIEI